MREPIATRRASALFLFVSNTCAVTALISTILAMFLFSRPLICVILKSAKSRIIAVEKAKEIVEKQLWK